LSYNIDIQRGTGQASLYHLVPDLSSKKNPL